MARGQFAKPEKQADSVIKELRYNVPDIKKISLGTANAYRSALIQAAKFLRELKCNSGLWTMTPEMAQKYLAFRQEEVGQKQLDMDRQALQSLMRHVSHKIGKDEVLTDDNGKVHRSYHDSLVASRAYSLEQMKFISEAQTEPHALATQIAYASGLRAHELLTLQRREEREPDIRKRHESKFHRLDEHQMYTVKGKGGLIREVMVPKHLAQQLEARRLAAPIKVTDREIHYTQHYDIQGGKKWSSSFSKASMRTLLFSDGAHGLRHSYAQNRMTCLTCHFPKAIALEIVSQEMGHFRPDITLIYLR
jgi:integrase